MRADKIKENNKSMIWFLFKNVTVVLSPFDSWKAFAIQTMHFNTGRRETRVWQRIFAHFPAICIVYSTVRFNQHDTKIAFIWNEHFVCGLTENVHRALLGVDFYAKCRFYSYFRLKSLTMSFSLLVKTWSTAFITLLSIRGASAAVCVRIAVANYS